MKKPTLTSIEEIDQELEDLIFNLRPKGDRSYQLKKISDDLRSQKGTTDYEMDYIFPPEIAKKSHPHWTPATVASRAIELLATTNESKVLDVGSGCGKFCLIAGLSAKGHFTGVEQRKNLVDVATEIANEFHLKNVSFIHANMLDLDWSDFDGLYLFNPFFEHVMTDPDYWIDDSLPNDTKIFDSYVQSVQTKLKTAKTGTKVVTYHGFGGDFPPGYSRVLKEQSYTGYLELWVKEN